MGVYSLLPFQETEREGWHFRYVCSFDSLFEYEPLCCKGNHRKYRKSFVQVELTFGGRLLLLPDTRREDDLALKYNFGIGSN